MKERPIIFSTEMVQKILSGTKTQTRRLIKPQPHYFKSTRFNGKSWEFSLGSQVGYDVRVCSHGQVGDRLWVKEAYLGMIFPFNGVECCYKADGIQLSKPSMAWENARYMPRKYSRLLLEIENIRVEGLNDISEKDAIAEGCLGLHLQHRDAPQTFLKPQEHFAHVWDEINGKKGFAWATNPFVWVIEFRRVEA